MVVLEDEGFAGKRRADLGLGGSRVILRMGDAPLGVDVRVAAPQAAEPT
jgi:hypothetical protein